MDAPFLPAFLVELVGEVGEDAVECEAAAVFGWWMF